LIKVNNTKNISPVFLFFVNKLFDQTLSLDSGATAPSFLDLPTNKAQK